MILALNLFDILIRQTEIYGSTIKKGQIVSKVAQVKKEDEKSKKIFENIKQIIQNTLFLGKIVKGEFENIDEFFKNKNNLLEVIKDYQFFSQGRYLTLSIFSKIIRECEYVETIIKSNLFSDIKFIENKIVEPWLKIVLDELINEEFTIFTKETGSSIKTFYGRAATWENIRQRFDKLKYKKDKTFVEIFPLKL